MNANMEEAGQNVLLRVLRVLYASIGGSRGFFGGLLGFEDFETSLVLRGP